MGFAKLAKLSESQIERTIREIAKDSRRVILTGHAKERMRQRKVTVHAVHECLREGRIRRPPEPNSSKGSLECRMERYCQGFNLAVVVALSDEHPGAIVVTVMDRD